MNARYDVLIVGGGPAGSMTAYRLAKAGLRVLIVDAKVFPRDKPCGGGLQHKAALRIPFDWQAVNRGSLHGLAFSLRFGERFTRKYPEPLVYSVLRVEFDNLLVCAAQEAGAELWGGVRVTGVTDSGSFACVHTDRGDLEGRFVVGADGANSVVRPTVNARSDYFWQVGFYCEIPRKYIISEAIDDDCMRVDWGTLPSGYAWIFPKNETVNVGIGCPASIGRMIKPYLAEFLKTEGALLPGAFEQLRFTGHQLPTLKKTTVVAKGRILLVGDAAGLIEPFTGDGISYGLHSAEIAAETLRSALESSVLDVREYQRRIMCEIGSELFWSRKLQSFFVTFPRMIHEVFRHNDKVWGAFGRVLRGEESFRVFRQKKFGALEFLWLPVDAFVERYETKKLTNLENGHNSFLDQASRVMGYIFQKI
jgi:geranylgeranyl reductase family protein